MSADQSAWVAGRDAPSPNREPAAALPGRMEWLGFLMFLGVVGYGAWEVFRERSQLTAGRPPYPPVRVHMDGPIQIVDLRGVPFPDNTQRALEFAHEALITMPPCELRVWVLPEPILAHWLTLSGLAWVVVAGRLLDGRKQPGRTALWAPGASAEQEALISAAGVIPWTGGADRGRPLRGLSAITQEGTSITMEERLGPVPSWPAELPPRPWVPATIYRTMLWVWVVQAGDLVFVDLRRASVAVVDSDGAGLAQAAAQLEQTEAAGRRIWLVSPWMLDRWAHRSEPVLEAWRGALASGPPAGADHLVVDGPGGDGVMLESLRALGLTPVDDQLSVTEGGRTFRILFPDVLRDLMLAGVWRDVEAGATRSAAD